MRDATYAELRDEPDVVLQALVNGTMNATWVTREIAKNELEARGTFASHDVYAAPPVPFGFDDWYREVHGCEPPPRMTASDPYDYASYGVTAAIAAIERQQRPVLHSVPIDPETLAARAMRTAKSAYDERYPEGA